VGDFKASTKPLQEFQVDGDHREFLVDRGFIVKLRFGVKARLLILENREELGN
jgi:hypothetical protein